MVSIPLKPLAARRLAKSAPPAATVRSLGSKPSSAALRALTKPRMPHHAPTVGTAALSTVALAAVGVAAALFPMALIAAVPVAVMALAFAAFWAKRRNGRRQVARVAAQEPAWPSTWKPAPLAPEILQQDKRNVVRVNAAKARHYLTYLSRPGVFAPDALLHALAHARSSNVRLWIQAGALADDQTLWASLDGDGCYFPVPGATRTVNLVHEGEHFWSLRLAEGIKPHGEKADDGTVTYQLITAPQSPSAVEVPALAGGDCMFHAWAAAENFDSYNAVSNVATKQKRANALRALSINTARGRINTGDTTLAAELARAADTEFNIQWKRGTEALANARDWTAEPEVLQTCVSDAQTHLFAAMRLLTSQQTQARAQVLAMLRETWQLQRRLAK